jgi:hypothetical protein
MLNTGGPVLFASPALIFQVCPVGSNQVALFLWYLLWFMSLFDASVRCAVAVDESAGALFISPIGEFPSLPSPARTVTVRLAAEAVELPLRSAFGTSHSSTVSRTNARIRVLVAFDGPEADSEATCLWGISEIGMPPKKPHVYEAAVADVERMPCHNPSIFSVFCDIWRLVLLIVRSVSEKGVGSVLVVSAWRAVSACPSAHDHIPVSSLVWFGV